MKLSRLITRRRAKWIGLVLCVLLGTALVSSIWFIVYVTVSEEVAGVRRIGLGSGTFLYAVDYREWTNVQDRKIEYTFELRGRPNLSLWVSWEDKRATAGNFKYLQWAVPLWMPLLLIAAPTAWLWYIDRRAKPWQCAKCRYDLRGLASEGNEKWGGKWGGACPECGTPRGGACPECGTPKKL